MKGVFNLRNATKFDSYFNLIFCFPVQRLTNVVQELEENEKDLVIELEHIAKERHSVELQYHGKCQENETLKATFIEQSRKNESQQSEMDILRKKLESEQKRNKDYKL